MENSENKKSKMKLQVFLDFRWHSEFSTEEIEINIPFIPRVGEWFCVEDFLSEIDKHKYNYGCYGPFYVRNIVHDFDWKKNIQRITIRVDDTESEHYQKNYEGR